MTPTVRGHRGDATTVKIVVTGPFAAGKTTLIRTISETAVLSTERPVSDDTRARKAQTTVAMDFGRITVERDLLLYLFGTPGQERFDFMWEILGDGMLGYVLLLDAGRPAADGAQILAAFRRNAPGVPFVVGLTRATDVSAAEETGVREALGLDLDVPVLACRATERASVRHLLLVLLHHVLSSLPEPRGPGAPDTADTAGTADTLVGTR